MTNLISSLKIINFRNAEKLQFNFTSKLNIITGRNGVGKTNILDAIFYLCTVRSNSSANDGMLIKKGEVFFRLEASHQGRVASSVSLKFKSEEFKTLEWNGLAYSKFSDHIGKIPVIFICPDDLELIKGGSETRRKFLDYSISIYNKEYLTASIAANKYLRQRNALLKSDHVDIRLLDLFDEKLNELSDVIYKYRKEFIREIIPVFESKYKSISEFENNVSIEYKSELENSTYAELARKSRHIDLLSGRTSSGIHRDDIKLIMDERDVRKTASQGQLKSVLLALRFAQYHVIRSFLQIKPILLLDDLFDRLDAGRVKNIADLVMSEEFGQVFITDTNANRIDDLIDISREDVTIFKMEELKH